MVDPDLAAVEQLAGSVAGGVGADFPNDRTVEVAVDFQVPEGDVLDSSLTWEGEIVGLDPLGHFEPVRRCIMRRPVIVQGFSSRIVGRH